MKIDYIRRDIPTEISSEGGAFIQLVNKETIGMDTTVAEALSSLYCIGDSALVYQAFTGLLKSVFEGIKLDGHARKIGDVTFYPSCTGAFDLDTGWDPLENSVHIVARLLNGIDIDITNWTFNDVTPGRVAYTVSDVSNGTVAGVVSNNKNCEINGSNFPDKANLTVSWVCGTKSGTVSQAHLSGSVSRLTIAKDAFASITSTEHGKTIAFTIKGCYNQVKKSAIMSYDSVAPTVTLVKQGTHDNNQLFMMTAEDWYIVGTGLELGTGDKVELVKLEGATETGIAQQTVASSTSTRIDITGVELGTLAPAQWEGEAKLRITKDSVAVEFTVTMVNE